MRLMVSSTEGDAGMTLQRNQDKINKEGFLTMLLSSTSVAFTYFVFGLLEMFVSGYSQYWFGLMQILPVALFLFLSSTCVLLLLQLVFRGRTRNLVSGIVFGVGVGLYLQGNLPFFDYPALDGSAVDWVAINGNWIGSAILWTVCIGAPIALYFTMVDLQKICRWGGALLLAVESIALVIILLSTNLTPKEKMNVLVDEDKFTLSEEENLVVFVLDTLDGETVNTLFEESPAWREKFSDFVFYRNTTGMYPKTRGAIPYILTGIVNDNQFNYEEEKKIAFEQTLLFDELHSLGYDTRLYTSENYIDRSRTDLIDNLQSVDYKVSSYPMFAALLSKLVGTRYMPHLLKQFVWLYTADLDSVKALDVPDAWVTLTNSNMENNSDLNFNKQMHKNTPDVGLAGKKAFRFYHLTGIHTPFTINEHIEYSETGSSTEEQQLKGSLSNVLEYVAYLQSAGVYKNTTILIMGDHGYKDLSQNPALLIHHADQQYGDTAKISDAPVSFADLQATYLDIIGSEKSATGISIFDVDEDAVRTRAFYSWPSVADSGEYLLPLTEYEVIGEASKPNSMHKTGVRYMPGEKIVDEMKNTVAIGSVLNVDKGDADAYIDYGFESDTTDTGYWSVGKAASITVELDDYDGTPFILGMYFSGIFMQEQRIEISINGISALEGTLSSSHLFVPITEKYMINGNALNIGFAFPDAVVPNREGIGDDYRELAVKLKSLLIGTLDAWLLDKENPTMYFNKYTNYDNRLIGDWFYVEDSGRWMSRNAGFYVKVQPEYARSIVIDCYTSRFLVSSQITINDVPVLSVQKSGIYVLEIPDEAVNSEGLLKIEFHNTLDEKSLRDMIENGLENNNDTRICGMGISMVGLDIQGESSKNHDVEH